MTPDHILTFILSNSMMTGTLTQEEIRKQEVEWRQGNADKKILEKLNN